MTRIIKALSRLLAEGEQEDDDITSEANGITVVVCSEARSRRARKEVGS